MSFSKLNVCESTQVAFNLFHMFRNNTVNLTETWRGEDYALSRYEDKEYPLEEGEVKPYDNEKLDRIARLLSHDCTEICVHDVVRTHAEFGAEFSERRLVQFYVHERGSRVRTIMSISVSREYVDGDEVSGLTAWTAESVELVMAVATDKNSRTGQGHTNFIKMGKIRPHGVQISPLMKSTVRGLLYFY